MISHWLLLGMAMKRTANLNEKNENLTSKCLFYDKWLDGYDVVEKMVALLSKHIFMFWLSRG